MNYWNDVYADRVRLFHLCTLAEMRILQTQIQNFSRILLLEIYIFFARMHEFIHLIVLQLYYPNLMIYHGL